MLDLKLTTLTVVKRADLVGRDEPMLWTMFIELSIATLNSHVFVLRTDPLKGKLAKAGKGDTVNIPASVGRFQRDSAGLFMVGVVMIAFDNDLRTSKQIRDGYAAGADALNQAILDHFAEFGFADISPKEMAQIQSRIATAVKNAFVANSAILTLLGGKPVGGDSYTRKLDANTINENISKRLRAKNDRAIYDVKGSLAFQRPP
jgi:hypothetical protein